MSLSMNAYAKINLAFDIAGRRDDGYHELSSVMQSISLHDEVTVEGFSDNKICVYCDEPSLPRDEKNTVYKAASLFFAYAGVENEGVSLSIKKHIPFQSGLGGGSADAAAALKLLNRFFCAGLSMEQLCGIALKVGADVPFCIRCGTAAAEGIGEKLTAISPLPDCLILVCKPGFGISTGQAYCEADKHGFGSKKYSPAMVKALGCGSLAQSAACLGNCFEDILGLKEITAVKSAILSAGALGACMTGSGSAVFGLFDSSEKAERCKTRLLTRYKDVFLCKPVRA